MSRWPQVPLGDIFEIARGGSPRPIEKYVTDDPNGINWVTIGDASEGSKYISSTRRRIKPEGANRSRSVKPGDFLLTNSMSFGHPYIMGTTGCIHDGWLVLAKKRADVDPEFFYYLLGSKEIYSEFERRAAGATVKNLNIELVRGVTAPLPPLPEQHRIADVLGRAEALRAKRREALAQMDALAGSTFSECFGDPHPRRSGWPQAALTDVCDRITDGTHRSPPIQTSGVPYVTAKHLKETGLAFHADPWFISEADHREIYRRCDPKLGDVLYIKDGATTGIAAVNEYSFEFSMLSSLALLRPTAGRLHARYLGRWLNMPTVKRNVLGAMAGVAIRRLTLAKLSKICIPIPPWSLQLEFALRIAAIEKLKALHRVSLAKLDELFASLQHLAFRGEL